MACSMAGRALIFLLALVRGTKVLAQTPPASTSCASSIATLLPCIGFLTGGYSAVPPGCCGALATMAVGSDSCFCQFLNMNKPSAFPFNQTQALLLSKLCHVNTPPLTQCTTAGSPLHPPVAIPPGSSSAGVLPSPASSTTGNGGAITANDGSQATSVLTRSGIGLVGVLLAIVAISSSDL